MATVVRPEKLARIAAGLARTFPDVGNVAPLRVLGEGFRSLAVEAAAGVVFRIAKSEAAAAGYRNEQRLLPRLRAHVPVAIPQPRWYVEAAEDFPFGVMGYRKVAGAPLSPALLAHMDAHLIAAGVASFLVALHRFPLEEAEALGLQPSEFAATETIRDTLLPALRTALGHDEYRIVATWWDTFLSDPEMRRYAPALRHGDLWYEHILIDTARPTVIGVVDFEHAALGDPAQDFATQMHLGASFLDLVLHAYVAAGGNIDAGLTHRIRHLWEFREFDGIHFAIQSGDTAEFVAAVEKLRRGPLLHPDCAPERRSNL